ncbi:tape measure protein [Aminipila terrae]|uniref:Tape measure protein n=1 Tax=Aminipila terrae TaxID=2697030 RepID=A0A6P1MGM5_9FIRM|nr:tape measure protein [Aminipila terrae]QHI72901.1 tape measure protein [Aminipila terrae]
MPTLSAMFKLYDGYSNTISKISQKTADATNKILRASGATDQFNQKLKNTSASANSATGSIGNYVRAALSIASAVKGMSIVDTYINTQSRLKLINDGLQTQSELQDKIFAAADQSRGAYASMAGSIAKLGMLAGDAFSSNDETIKFAALMQKSFKLSGASTEEQTAGMYQLTQAMAAGKLQGDEFRSIMENAPMLAQAIATYTGKTKGDLKQMSADGTITADIIKNAMFAAADEINEKFKKMPMTFGDVWNKFKNSATRAFSDTFKTINKLINSSGFQSMFNNAVGAVYTLGSAINWIIQITTKYWSFIGPILIALSASILAGIIMKLGSIAALFAKLNFPVFLIVAAIGLLIEGLDKAGISMQEFFNIASPLLIAIGAVLLASIIKKLFLMIPVLWAQAAAVWAQVAAWLILHWQVLLVIVAIALIVIILQALGVKASQVFGFIGGCIGVVIALLQNLGTAVYNAFIFVLKSVDEVVTSCVNDAIAAINLIIRALNKIPGVKINLIDGINESYGDLKYQKFANLSEAYDAGSKIGKKFYSSASDKLGSIGSKLGGFMKGPNLNDLASGLGTTGNPMKVEGTGNDGKVDVNMSDEDLQYLRDIAERDFVNKFSTATLAPNIQVTFGDVHETADVDKMYKRMGKIMQQQLASVGEGDY